MLANINNDALKLTLSSHQNLAGNTVLISLVPLVQIIQSTQKKKKHEEQGSSTTLCSEYHSSYREWKPGWSLFYINHMVKLLRY